jgi:hypothetical protein
MSVNIVTGPLPRRAGFDSRQGLGMFLFATAYRLAVRQSQPPTQLVAGALSPEINLLGREANHSTPSSAKVKNVWSYTSYSPHTSSWRCV